jgi:parallel beta-helix repeat protein
VVNRAVFASVTILCLLSISSITGLIQVVRADGETIYINADGSITPPTAPIYTADSITYTLTGDITYPAYSGISIQRSNIAIDGNGYAIQGFNQSGTGISINGINNVTIKSTDVEGFLVGVYISGSNNNLNGNNITNNGNGIHLYSSSKSIITMNNIERNSLSGILLEYSYDSNIICKNAFFFDGLTVWASWDNSVVDNLVNGKPLLYLENVSNYTIDVNAGQVVLVNCNQINLKNLTLSHTTFGIDLWNTVGSSISGCVMTSNVYGIYLAESSNNSVNKNNISANYYHGIFLESSSANVLDENSITANNDDGVVFMDDSSSNIVRGNSIVSNGNYGILLESANNWIYQNNFVNNTHQVGSLLPGSTNVWDDGLSGNYWSDHNGTDLYSGSSQNVPGSDGIGDTPYTIDVNNIDHYPLMKPYLPFENQTVIIGADGSVDPSGAPILRRGDLYTLTGHITSDTDGIVIERDNIVLNGAGYTVQGTWASYSEGIDLTGRSNVTIGNVNITAFFYGVYLNFSSNNSISGNNLTNSYFGIYLDSSPNNSVSGNNITNDVDGVYLDYSSNNSVNGNDISNEGAGIYHNVHGVYLYSSSNNNVSGNNMTENSWDGIRLEGYSNNNSISGNNMTNNGIGITLYGSSDNKICHNNFINNQYQVGSAGSINVWDDGVSGNYWSDYLTKYPNAAQVDSSGVWNTPYVIDTNNTDYYPLMVQYAIPEFPPIQATMFFMSLTLLAVIIYKKKGVKRSQS